MSILNKIITHFRNLKLNKKLIGGYLSITLIPIFILFVYFSKTVSDTVTDKNLEENSSEFDQLVFNIENELSKYSLMADNILSETLIQKHLITSKNQTFLEKYSDYRTIKNLYSSQFILDDSTYVKIKFYIDNPNILLDSDFLNLIDSKVYASDWYQELMSSKTGKIIIDPYVLDTSNTKAFAVVRSFKNDLAPDFTNIFFLEIKTNALYQYIRKQGENKEIFILNDNNIVIASSDTSLTGMSAVDIPTLVNYNVADSNVGTLRTQNKDFLVFSGPLTISNYPNQWRIVSIVSNQNLMNRIREASGQFLLTFIVLIMCSFAFILLLTYHFTSRIRNLIKNMAEIKDGNFSTSIDTQMNDEIGMICISFKQMVDRMNTLISDVYIAQMEKQTLQLEKSKAEIHALQSQMNPHFIFNTLESIRMNLIIKRDRDTAQVVEDYACLIRESISWDTETITLSKELEFIQYYINIQKFRHPDKFEYIIDVEPTLLVRNVPKFTIQPIVENAIVHGLEPKAENGTVTISIAKDVGFIVITVSDDGIGMTAEEADQLRASIYGDSVTSKSRIGLRNIHHRIQLVYGSEYGLELNSIKGKGTVIKLRLPLEST